MFCICIGGSHDGHGFIVGDAPEEIQLPKLKGSLTPPSLNTAYTGKIPPIEYEVYVKHRFLGWSITRAVYVHPSVGNLDKALDMLLVEYTKRKR